ncbi:MAG TPA: hypothetical protein VFM65_06630 [Flavobacteriaceae bacterium]|nr:hypothetical protein [Flavobacteriaceae bacterium]
MKKYIFLTITLSLFNIANTFAQQTDDKAIFTDIRETVFVHGNTTTLLTGESLYYTFYTWNTRTASLSQISKIGYVELVNKEGESVLKQKIALTNGIGHGDFFIPTKLETGSYKLVAYTRWMLNKPLSGLFQMNIFVINPFQPAPESTISKAVNDSLQTKTPKTISFQKKNSEIFSLENSNYGLREKVTFTLSSETAQLENGHYSISVRKVDELPEIAPINAEKFIKSLDQNPEKDGNRQNYLPELRGELIVGKIENKANPENVKDKSVALSIPGENFAFELVNTDKNGVFRFILNDETRKESTIIQIMEEDREKYSITLKPINTDFSSLQFEKINLAQNLEETIEERSIAVQIENAYYYLKKDSILPEMESKPFFYPLAKEYVLEEYTSFPSLEETILEITPAMYATKKNGKYMIHTRDYYNDASNNIYGQTLVLVDGLLLQDLNKFFDYDTRKIQKISIVPRGYVYGPKIFDGVVNFVTKEQDFENNLVGDYVLKTELLRPLPEKMYFQPYKATRQNSRIPDYRYQLLWLPEVSPTDETKTITFYTSDVTGTFEISMQGFTASGKPISATETFVVE